jgi:hypothetical protein
MTCGKFLFIHIFTCFFTHSKYKGLQTGYALCRKNIASNSKDVSNKREDAVAIAGAPETILGTQGRVPTTVPGYSISRRHTINRKDAMPPKGIPAKRGYQQQ